MRRESREIRKEHKNNRFLFILRRRGDLRRFKSSGEVRITTSYRESMAFFVVNNGESRKNTTEVNSNET